jgi:alpha-glucoside transport system substrate-binding protein
MKKQRIRSSWLLLPAVLALVIASCGGGTSSSTTTTVAGGQTTTTSGGTTTTTSGAMTTTTSAMTTTTSGPMTLDVMGAFRGTEADEFQKVIDLFQQQNPDITVNYEGSAQFETDIQVRVKAGNPPDLAFFPQPGAVAQFANSGDIIPLPDSVVSSIKSNYQPGWLDLGSVNGTPYGAFYRVNAKGFVWYNKPAFEAAGYQVPTDMASFQSLLDQMKTSGTAPFCIGISSGDSTGWPGTDWVETYMLRSYPPSDYVDWYTGKLPFTSTQVDTAWNDVGKIWLDPSMVYGGTQTIASTDYKASAAMLFDATPKCWFVMQGSFVTGFFPDAIQKDLDTNVGVFPWPNMMSGSTSSTLEVGGDELVMFKGHDSPAATKFMEFLTTPQAAAPWAKQGDALFPQKGQDLSVYPNQVVKTLATTLTNAQSVEFDASDQMPPAVNQAFWKGVTDWVTGTPLSQVEQTIDSQWNSGG